MRVTHFVTRTGPTAAPLPGAKVSLYLLPYGDAPFPGPVCTTAADGTCTIDTKELLSGGRYGTLVGVVEAAGHAPLVVWGIQQPSSYQDESLNNPYVGTLVTDRLLVTPGDKLHVTGARVAAGMRVAARLAQALICAPRRRHALARRLPAGACRRGRSTDAAAGRDQCQRDCHAAIQARGDDGPAHAACQCQCELRLAAPRGAGASRRNAVQLHAGPAHAQDTLAAQDGALGGR